MSGCSGQASSWIFTLANDTPDHGRTTIKKPTGSNGFWAVLICSLVNSIRDVNYTTSPQTGFRAPFREMSVGGRPTWFTCTGLETAFFRLKGWRGWGLPWFGRCTIPGLLPEGVICREPVCVTVKRAANARCLLPRLKTIFRDVSGAVRNEPGQDFP
jgi:hypothetical protein